MLVTEEGQCLEMRLIDGGHPDLEVKENRSSLAMKASCLFGL